VIRLVTLVLFVLLVRRWLQMHRYCWNDAGGGCWYGLHCWYGGGCRCIGTTCTTMAVDAVGAAGTAGAVGTTATVGVAVIAGTASTAVAW
jgi:hypothetical protein